MIDHVLGRPSSTFRKLQVFAVVSFWSLYLLRGDPHGLPVLRRISARIGRRLTAWQTVALTLLWLYICRNFAKITGLSSPEPLANLYSRSYFRATWVTTALDAGFWTAMPIRSKPVRDLASMVFSVFYLFAAEQADEKVRKVRATLTVEHLRVSWEKSTTPYLRVLMSLLRPRLCKYPPRKIRIARPPESVYEDPVVAWLYFDGPLSELASHEKVVLDIPGGGFVAMTPRNNDDRLLAWAGRLGVPIVSLDYRKAPEYPYPYALNEIVDVYSTLVQSRGRCIGMTGEFEPRIVMTGDSAGGNLAAAAVLMTIQSSIQMARRPPRDNYRTLRPPDGLILVYPGLDMNIGNWMTDEQMSLIQDRRTRKTNANILRRKSEDYYKLTPSTPHHSDHEDEDDVGFIRRTETAIKLSTLGDEEAIIDPPLDEAVASSMAHISGPPSRRTSSTAPAKRQTSPPRRLSSTVAEHQADVASGKPRVLKTRLAMSSMISYFNDRILTPEMMRAMIILYIGPHSRPDFSTDFLLSPLLAPESLLSRFPKTYFLTGERDPMVDDTVIFAGRLRQAKYAAWVQRKEMGLDGVGERREFDERDHVEVHLIPGISHGFMQFVGVFPEGWKHVYRCADWVAEIFRRGEDESPSLSRVQSGWKQGAGNAHEFKRQTAGESSADDYDVPLEMSMTMTSSSQLTASEERRGKRSRRNARGGPRGREKRRGSLEEKSKSLVSLASEEDLLGRRMQGLTGGLMGPTLDN